MILPLFDGLDHSVFRVFINLFIVKKRALIYLVLAANKLSILECVLSQFLYYLLFTSFCNFHRKQLKKTRNFFHPTIIFFVDRIRLTICFLFYLRHKRIIECRLLGSHIRFNRFSLIT